jgi:hypothetical protein
VAVERVVRDDGAVEEGWVVGGGIRLACCVCGGYERERGRGGRGPTVMVHPIQDVAELHVVMAVAVDCDVVATLSGSLVFM